MRKIYFGILFFFLLSVFKVTGQQPQVIAYNSTEGYPAYPCWYMMQDHNGWMWFSAEYEILRYDGYRFKTYLPASGIELSYLFNLIEVGDEIWVNASPYLLKIDGDSLRRLEIKNNNTASTNRIDEIFSVLTHRKQQYFLCKNGLFILSNRELKPLIPTMEIINSGGDNFFIWNDSLLLAFDQQNSNLIVFNLNQNKYYTLPEHILGIKQHKKRLYIAEPRKGISRLVTVKTQFDFLAIKKEMEVPIDINKPVKLFAVDGGRNFWIIYKDEEAIRVTPEGRQQQISQREGFRGLNYLNSLLDRENNLWITTRSSILKFPVHLWERFTYSENLISNWVVGLKPGMDSGQVLITTTRGISVLQNEKIYTLFQNKVPFLGTIIKSDGNIIFYFSGNLLLSARLNPHSFEITDEKILARLPTPVITAVADENNHFYLSCFYEFHVYANGQTKKLANATFKVLFFDSRKRLWAGRFAEALYCYQITHASQRPEIKHLLNTNHNKRELPEIKAIRAIAEDRQGHILVGTRYNGLFILTINNDSISKVDYFNKSIGLSGNSIWDISVDEDGTSWIATSGGINSMRFKEGRWVIKEESKSRQIKAAGAILATPGNQIWVSSYPGLITFKTDEEPALFPFTVSLSTIRVNGKKLIPRNKNQLKAGENDIRIEFSANTYRFENEIEYSWRLRPGDQWSDPTTAHIVNFSALKPGTYSFSVRAKDAFNQWSKNQADFQFTILPPLIQRPAFIIGLILLLLIILYSIYRFRVTQIKKIETLRSNIARDLHDEIGSALTSISILSKVSKLSLKTDYEKSETLLQKVIDQSRKMQQNVNDIVWTIKPGNDRMENMVAHMRDYLARTLEPAALNFSFTVDESLLQQTIGMPHRRDFFLIFKEAINNVLKHANAKNVFITLRYCNEKIHLKVHDDGIGLDSGRIKSGNGLQNMKARASLLNGEIQIYNDIEGGCSVELKMPAK